MPNHSTIERPQRWDQPLDPDLTSDRAARLAQLMSLEPFASMDPNSFSKKLPLEGILRNDCRILDFEKGDIIVREGDYGSSAFLILSGQAIVALKKLPAALLGRSEPAGKGWFKTIAQLWSNSSVPETRSYPAITKSSGGASDNNATGIRTDGDATRVFLHDIPRVIPAGESVTLETGEIFGELSALTRTPRSATVVAGEKAEVLEIRWQGFRELLNSAPALKTHVERLYRENSLRAHLREIDLLSELPLAIITQIADMTRFESYGSFQWNQQFKSTAQKDISDRILSEPLIAEEGAYVDGLVLIRNGFARLSRSHGAGHQTIAYLGKGQVSGFRELCHNWKTGQQRPWMLSLRAVGYVDVLKIPVAVVESLILPNLPDESLPEPLPSIDLKVINRRAKHREQSLDKNLLEFLVDRRYVNGTQAMVIDLDRCTRCDDCVSACASTHDNNPRFIRHGEKHDHWMFATACMHCLDPVCMIGCPTGAIARSETTGNVTINDDTCIGCSTCANSCPYQNIRMVEINDSRGLPILSTDTHQPIVKATKCDLCADQPAGPACQNACPHDALVRIDLTTADDMKDWTNR